MKLIIDISDKDYEKLKDGHIPFSILDVIQNGTPIPKGHGDLIDRNKLLRFEPMWYHLSNGDVACPKIDIENAPTIIESDKEQTK